MLIASSAALDPAVTVTQTGACSTVRSSRGDDRPGAVAEVLQKLADAEINVTAVDGVSAGAGRWGAILWVKQQSVNKAAKVLQAI